MQVESQVTKILVRSGIDFERLPSSSSISFRAKDFDRNKGFRIEVVETTSTIMLSFSLESMAADLARLIRANVNANEVALRAITEGSLTANSGRLFRVNNQPFLSIDSALEIANWYSVAIEDTLPKPVDEPFLKTRVDGLLTAVLMILPTEEVSGDSELQDAPFDVEGAMKSGAFTSFERSAKNRRICLAILGYGCKICGVDLEERYGDVATNFIHVHHIVPVSRMLEPSPVNPTVDLIPVCPNCHYIMHRKDPPIHPNEVRLLLGRGLVQECHNRRSDIFDD